MDEWVWCYCIAYDDDYGFICALLYLMNGNTAHGILMLQWVLLLLLHHH